MIKYLSDDTKYKNVTAKLKDKDVFFTRINVLYKSYGLNCDFLDIWYQSFNEDYVSLISRLDNQFILFLTENSNIQEIEEFLNVLGFSHLLFNEKYSLNFNSSKSETGLIMKREFIDNNIKENNCIFTTNNEYKDVFNFFNNCNSSVVKISDYGYFVTDLHSKVRVNCSKIYSLEQKDKIVSCAIITGDERCKIISPIATLPQYRNNDYAKSLLNNVKEDNLYLFCEDNLKECYTKMGFNIIGKWKEIHR